MQFNVMQHNAALEIEIEALNMQFNVMQHDLFNFLRAAEGWIQLIEHKCPGLQRNLCARGVRKFCAF